MHKKSGLGPGSKVTSKVTSVYTCCILLHSPAGQAITKKLKSSKKVCELIASSNLQCILHVPVVQYNTVSFLLCRELVQTLTDLYKKILLIIGSQGV